LVHIRLPRRRGENPRRAAHRGPDLRLAAPSEGTRMLSLINPDLLWLALGFIFSMAGMLATYPE